MAQVQQRGVEDIQPGSPVGTKRVPVGSPIYNDVVTFLYEEATLLDQIRLQEWAERLDTDLVYTVPLRQTRLAAEEERPRLARDLHDAVTQTIYSAALTAEALPADDPLLP